MKSIFKPRPKEPDKTGLILQGGGARGAYQAGALRAIAEIYGESANPFPILSGTSVGAFNACFLGANAANFQHATRHLEKLWKSLKTEYVFDPGFRGLMKTGWRIIRTFGFGMQSERYGWLNNQAMRELLDREFDPKKLQAAMREGHLDGFSITASSYSRGISVSFFQSASRKAPWARARHEGRPATIGVDHVMASAALPCIFPAVKIGNSYYGDGALRSHEPFAPAIRLGANRILVISTRDAAIKREDSEPQTYPSATDMIGHAFDILFNDSLDSDIERLLRINRLIAHIARKKRGALDLKPIDLLVLQPSKDLRDLARKYEEGIPKTLKFILKKAGDGRLSSYLLFEPEFIQALIDLGYRDTIEKRAEIDRFLHPKKET